MKTALTLVPASGEEMLWRRARIARSGCMEWQGATTNGYGVFCFRTPGVRQTRSVRAHRYAYHLAIGVVPDGMDVCHHCDNRRCINPAHLFLGTRADNMADMVAKGRQNRNPRAWGEKHGNSKLTEIAVLAMRYARALGSTYDDLARDFGVSRSSVANIVTRRTWRHVA